MKCLVCNQRKAKRQCLQYERAICPQCCAELRLSIKCPENCKYLKECGEYQKKRYEDRVSQQIRPVLAAYQASKELYNEIFALFEEMIFRRCKKDENYLDHHIVEGIKRALNYFLSDADEEREILLNRIGCVESDVVELMTQAKLEHSLSRDDISNILRFIIFYIENVMNKARGPRSFIEETIQNMEEKIENIKRSSPLRLS